MPPRKIKIRIFDDKVSLGTAAAGQAAKAIGRAVRDHGKARIIVATGSSQFEFLNALTGIPGIEWTRVEMFHLDEYIGISEAHPASFCKYLRERLIDKVKLTNYHLLDAEKDPPLVIRETGKALASAPIDLAVVGIGENGHLAFNDPPADFDTQEPYLIVKLDDACRMQQFRQGWFPTIEDVPREAISMSVRQILKAREIICIAPDARKAKIVRSCVEGEIGPFAPASILRTHSNTTVYLDTQSASLLISPNTSKPYGFTGDIKQ